jgi:hypothetical protein
MKITDQAKADAYFEELVRTCGKPRAEAETIERANLGYYAGYYDDETRARVERLFNCVHPIFGPIAQNGPPSARDAFEAGKAMSGGLVSPSRFKQPASEGEKTRWDEIIF